MTAGEPLPPPQVSPDGKFYWDGRRWVPMPLTVPDIGQRSAKPPWTRDWANWSLLLAALGWFAAFLSKIAPVLLLLGLVAGVVAITKSPYRGRAITGIVISALGLMLVAVEIIVSVTR